MLKYVKYFGSLENGCIFAASNKQRKNVKPTNTQAMTHTKTTNFAEFINAAVDKGAKTIKIYRSDLHCGCVKPNDIVAVAVTTKSGEYRRLSLVGVFDTPYLVLCNSNADTMREYGYKGEDK